MMNMHAGLHQWFTNLLIKSLLCMQINFLLLTEKIQQLAEELHKPIIRKFEKNKVCSSFIDNIWGPDQVNMQSTKKHH